MSAPPKPTEHDMSLSLDHVGAMLCAVAQVLKFRAARAEWENKIMRGALEQIAHAAADDRPFTVAHDTLEELDR